jgi:transposase
MADDLLGALHDVLGARYAEGGCPSIHPTALAHTSLLQVVYRARSDRLLKE